MEIYGVIAAAGYGTRFLPITKTVPKEMLPLVDLPAIHFIIEEFRQAGIKNILIVTSRRKKILEDYFDYDFELTEVLQGKNDSKKLKTLQRTSFDDLNIFFRRQDRMRGTAHVISLAKSFTKNHPFVLAYPDDLFFGTPNAAEILVKAYEKTKKNVISLYRVPEGDVDKYGIAAVSPRTHDPYYTITDMIEKPTIDDAPSTWAVPGRYLFKPVIFDIIDSLTAVKNADEVKEVTQTDAIQVLIKNGDLIGCTLENILRFDTGNKIGYILATLYTALQRNDISPQLKTLITHLYENNFIFDKNLLFKF